MSRMSWKLVAILTTCWATFGCINSLSSKQLVNAAVQAMGGINNLENIRSIIRKGNGTRTNMGQSRIPGEPEPTGSIRNYVEVLDQVNTSAGFDYDFEIGDFKQHRREVFTKYDVGFETKPVGYIDLGGRMAAVSPAALVSYSAFSSPEMALRREITLILLSAVETALTAQTVRQESFNGKMCNFGQAKTRYGESMTMYFDPDTKLLEGYEVIETDTVLGDVPVQYVFEDYRKVSDVLLPFKLKIRRNSQDSAEITYDSIAFELGATKDWFTIPPEVEADAKKAAVGPYVPMKVSRMLPGVYLAQGFTHNSLIVEFPDYVAVLEAPLDDVQTRVMIDEVRKFVPLKEIRYVIPTHHHSDHIGGVRSFVARGATVIVEKRHEAIMRKLLESRHAHFRDELQTAKDTRGGGIEIGDVEVFEGKKELANGGRSIELHAIEGSPHASPAIVAYMPRERLLFQSDLFPAAGPVAAHLRESIAKLNLRPDRIVGGHGAPTPAADLAKAQ